MTVVASMLGVLLTKWTIRLALACYVAYLAGWLAPPNWQPRRNPGWPRMARIIWTLGCVLFVVHVGLAFHFYHRWSHAVAWQSTAEKTKELLGVAVGDGIYCSYLFLALWVLDVILLWLRPERGEVANGTPSVAAQAYATGVPIRSNKSVQTPWLRVLVHFFLLFVAFNGAIIFEGGPTRWTGIAACLALGFLAAQRLHNYATSPDTKCPIEAVTPTTARAEEVVAT